MSRIAVTTVMLHRLLVDEGFAFPTDVDVGEDMLAWIDLAMRYTLLGIDEPLSIVGGAVGWAALQPAKQVLALSGVVEALERHPLHRRHSGQIEELRQALRDIARNWVAAGRKIETIRSWQDPEEAANPVHPAFPAKANVGRW